MLSLCYGLRLLFGCILTNPFSNLTDQHNLPNRAFGKINIIVNNAGFTFDGMLHKTTDKQFQLMLEVHNAAPFRIIRAAAKYMRLKDGEPRSIVNVRFLLMLYRSHSCALVLLFCAYVLTTMHIVLTYQMFKGLLHLRTSR